MSFNKILKIICINLLIFIGLISLTEVYLFNNIKNEFKEQFKIRQEMDKENGSDYERQLVYSLKPGSFNYLNEKLMMRKPEGLNYKKPPILIFGCSFAYGDGLNNSETFSYKLSHLSKRPVYNRSVIGWGTQHMLYQLKRDDFYKEVKPPEYIIYTLINDHINRLFRYQFPPPNNYIVLRYKNTKNGFKEIHPFLEPLWGLYSVNKLQNYTEKNILMSDTNRQKNSEYFYLMMKECKRLAKQHYPNAKFVIFIYRERPCIFMDDKDLQKKLRSDGFIIIDSNQLTPKDILARNEYKNIDHCHPSGKAWDMIVPALIKKLSL